MLRLDRYLERRDRTLDLASGRLVDVERSAASHAEVRLFQSRGGRTLIDCESLGDHRVEVWEDWVAGAQPPAATRVVIDFLEVLESARLGAPRAFDLPAMSARHDLFLRRLLAREARTRGWLTDRSCSSWTSRACRRRRPWRCSISRVGMRDPTSSCAR
jgi:hypothetical protein